MNDLTALANKLAALIAEDAQFIDGARVISQGGAPAALPAILNEIDDTVLERVLVFTLDETVVRMAVAGRRLRGISDVSGTDAGDIAGKAMSHEDEDALQQAGRFLTSLCVSASRVTVRPEPAEPFGDSADVGLSAKGLATAWNVDLDAQPAPPMERFLAANTDGLLAYLYVLDGTVTDTSGDVSALQKIWDDQATAFRKRHKGIFARKDGPTLVGLENALDGNTAVALAIAGGEVSLFTYETDLMPAILTSWYAITS